MPSSKGLTECKALLEMQKGRKKKKVTLRFVRTNYFLEHKFPPSKRKLLPVDSNICDVFKVGILQLH